MSTDRGRRSDRDRNGRRRADALAALLRASTALVGSGHLGGALRGSEGHAGASEGERALIGLVRQAAGCGASVAEIAAASGRPRAWVKSQINWRNRTGA